MIYKYAALHNVSFSWWLRLLGKTLSNNFNSFFVKPIEANIRSCFVVGCGHSGTTLLAAKLGNSKQCYLISRETNTFMPSRGLYSSKLIAQEWIYAAETLGKSLVIEKTPKHIHCISRIRRILPDCKIIVTLRNPLDNCASLYMRFGNLKFAVDRWLIDNREVFRNMNSSGTLLIKYEDLTERPSLVFKNICSFLDIPWDASILHAQETGYSRVKPKGDLVAIRAAQVKNGITPNSGKWKQILSDEQACYVLRRTSTLAVSLGYSQPFLNMIGNPVTSNTT